jgi:hypothetical protein
MNRFSRICLLVIVASLTVIALRSIVKPQPVVAAAHYKYLAVTTTTLAIQTELDRHVAGGCELAAPLYSEQPPAVALIFRKSEK